MTNLYLETFSGISGDMFIGALLDLGIDFKEFQKRLSLLGVKGYKLSLKRVAHSSIFGTDFKTYLATSNKDDRRIKKTEKISSEHIIHHRGLNDILKLIKNSKLSDYVKKHSIAVFKDIGKAEANVHHLPLEKVHFHEVGALDSIVDIVGAFVGLEMLQVKQVYCSEVCDGSGFINVAHGVMPVPVPAVMQMRVGAQIPVRQLNNIRTELVTPTGMGILKEIVNNYESVPKDWEIKQIGYGFGDKKIPQFNALRILKCEKKN